MVFEKKPIAEGIVADVLDDAAAVGIRTGLLKLGGSERGIAGKQKRGDGGAPGQVDQLLVSEERVGTGGRGESKAGKRR